MQSPSVAPRGTSVLDTRRGLVCNLADYQNVHPIVSHRAASGNGSYLGRWADSFVLFTSPVSDADISTEPLTR